MPIDNGYTFGTDREVLNLKPQEKIYTAKDKLNNGLFLEVRPTEHIKNVFDEGELDQNSTIRNFRIFQQEGSREVTEIRADVLQLL